jgi:hypothetical protein
MLFIHIDPDSKWGKILLVAALLPFSIFALAYEFVSLGPVW